MYLGPRYDDPPPPDGCRNLILLLILCWAVIGGMLWMIMH